MLDICFRSTTSKRPQPNSKLQQQQAEPDIEYNDQTYSFSKNSKVKSPGYDLNVKPLQYQVNISHSESDRNDLSVKSLDDGRRGFNENSGEEEDDIEYLEDYEDDYGVILSEDDRIKKEKVTTEVPKISTTQATTNKPDDHTVIIFDNFILPKNNEKVEETPEEESDDAEYEYEYIDEVETSEKPQTTKTPEKIEITTFRDPKRILGESVVSFVTSKTVVNGSMPNEDEEEVVKTTTEPENYPSTVKPITKSTTDNYFVIASVQTSRSVSGAHFLPFPHVEQRETIQTRAELSGKKSKEESAADSPIITTQIPEAENISAEEEDIDDHLYVSTTSATFEEQPTTLPTTFRNSPLPSTESIIDKLDGIQSDLSLGVLSGEFPILKDTSSKKIKTTSTTSEAPQATEISTTVKPLVLIRKFSPKSTTVKPTVTTKAVKSSIRTTTTEEPVTTTPNSTSESNRVNKKISFDAIETDDLDGLLPPGYKPRNSFKNKKFGATSQPQIVKEELLTGKIRNATISRSFKSQPSNQDVKFKSKEKEETSKKNSNKLFDSDAIDISKFLPADFKVNKKENESLAVIPLDSEDITKFLPPGFKLKTSSASITEKPIIQFVAEENINKFLPPGYKPPVEEEKEDAKIDLSSIFSKIKFQEPVALLPPGFKEVKTESTSSPGYKEEKVTESTTKSNKLIFPTRPYKIPSRTTTPKTLNNESAKPSKSSQNDGPKPPEIIIKKGPPTRATTEFTGWPSKATTPLSIEKILELQKNAERINIADILFTSTTEGTTSTSSTTTSTTTTTTTTPRPREATVCNQDCSLAATIRIIEGVEWSPELLTHHTEEYKKLASDLETSLNEVYLNSPMLSKWFKGVRIDSFSKGSVLVDYFIELNQVPEEMNTTEIKRIFHDALEPVNMQNTPEFEDEGLAQPIIKEAFKLGDYVVDPSSTDFIGKILIFLKIH